MASTAPAQSSKAKRRSALGWERAAALYDSGRSAFEQGNYERALADLEASYELSRRPFLLFEIALCMEALHREAEALIVYRRYLRKAPNAEHSREARSRIDNLQSELGAAPEAQRRGAAATGGGDSDATGPRDSAPASRERSGSPREARADRGPRTQVRAKALPRPGAATQPKPKKSQSATALPPAPTLDADAAGSGAETEQSRGGSPRVLTWIAAGAALVAGGSAYFFWQKAESDYRNLLDWCSFEDPICTPEQHAAWESNVHRYDLLTNITLDASAICLAAAVALYFIEGDGDDDDDSAGRDTTLAVGPGGIVLSGSF
ncbi:MAG: hypothetical protein MJD61_11590 [Proteobacteria bacterium]|nr:hypothetical protein [Pseudomonadota bacterium]